MLTKRITVHQWQYLWCHPSNWRRSCWKGRKKIYLHAGSAIFGVCFHSVWAPNVVIVAILFGMYLSSYPFIYLYTMWMSYLKSCRRAVMGQNVAIKCPKIIGGAWPLCPVPTYNTPAVRQNEDMFKKFPRVTPPFIRMLGVSLWTDWDLVADEVGAFFPLIPQVGGEED